MELFQRRRILFKLFQIEEKAPKKYELSPLFHTQWKKLYYYISSKKSEKITFVSFRYFHVEKNNVKIHPPRNRSHFYLKRFFHISSPYFSN